MKCMSRIMTWVYYNPQYFGPLLLILVIFLLGFGIYNIESAKHTAMESNKQAREVIDKRFENYTKTLLEESKPFLEVAFNEGYEAFHFEKETGMKAPSKYHHNHKYDDSVRVKWEQGYAKARLEVFNSWKEKQKLKEK